MRISFIPSILVFLLLLSSSLDAQRRRPQRNQDVEIAETLSDKINYEIRIGNISFNSGFGISGKPSVGYKINKTATFGVGYRIDYEFINNFNNDFSVFGHGPMAFGRVKAYRNFYVQGEYQSYQYDSAVTNEGRGGFFSAGLGMVQGGDNWKFSLEVNFLLDDVARDYFRLVEPWFVFSKNF